MAMNTCPHCGGPVADDHRFCQQCGRPLRGEYGAPATGLPRTLPVDVLFGHRTQLVMGRAPDCDVCLPHPSVSRRHALLERTPLGLRLHDLGSVNGIFVNGRRVLGPTPIHEGERVGIGPLLFSLSNGIIHTVDSSQSLRLEARGLEKVVSVPGGTRKLLDNISLTVEPGEFVSLLGPSGSGKSTLMDCLNGRRPATGGHVFANGEDFYRHFDSFRQSLGYVPQRDIVHTQLTVCRALYYTARLRLPTDTQRAEVQARIEDVLRLMELGPHRDTLVANLSGGQIKRVSLGAELLARPCLLYIDEATSGLDAGTEARMMRLFRQLADEGKSVVCITHNVENVDRCHLALILSRGKLAFYGPPSEAPMYFGVRRLSDIYDRLAEREPEAWERDYVASALCQEFVQKRRHPAAEGAAAQEPPRPTELGDSATRFLRVALPAPTEVKPRAPSWHQFLVLTARYAELLGGDRRSLRLLWLQAPIVALFLLLGFVHKPYSQKVLAPRTLSDSERAVLQAAAPLLEQGRVKEFIEVIPPNFRDSVRQTLELEEGAVGAHELLQGMLDAQGPVVPSRLIVDPRFTYMLLFILTVTVLWFGCNNAAKEIVKEEAIYGRERAVNLRIPPYLASKFLVLSALTAMQTFLLMLVIYGTLEVCRVIFGHEVPFPAYRLALVPQFGVLVLLGMTGVAMGLLLSACVSSPDRANTLPPYVLIPQIILGGGIISVKEGVLYLVAVFVSPVYWAFRGVRLGETTLPPDLPVHMDYDDSVWIVCAALALQAAALLAATAWFLRRKDVRRA